MTTDSSTDRHAIPVAEGEKAVEQAAPLDSVMDRSPSPDSAAVRVAEGADATPSEDKTVISKRPPLAVAPPASSSPQHLGQTLIGKRLEHYELDEFVGGGGMGAVFRATDTRLGRTVAIKVLSRNHTDEETIRRFRNEAQSAARLDHPNIARVYYVGEEQGWNFIVFEFIEGRNLRDIVAQHGPLSVEDALNYTLQVAEALAHSSSRDVVHRDIKPSNVLVTMSGQAKLVDMGLARLHQVESSSDDLTASGVTLGTFDYISPEQARDPRAADVRSDLYSLGCTLYFMLSGRPPFPDGTPLQKLIRHSSEEATDLRVFRSDLNPKVSELLSKMLAKRPSQRPQSAGELVAEILSLGQHLGLASIAEQGQVVRPAAATIHHFWFRAWQAAAAVAALVVAIVLLEAYSPTQQISSEAALRPKFSKPPIAQPLERETAAGAGFGAAVGAAATANGAPAPPSAAPAISPAGKSGPQTTSPVSLPAAGLATTDAPSAAVTPHSAAADPQLLVPAIAATIETDPIEAAIATSSSVPTSSSAAAVKPKRIIVASGPMASDPETEYTTTLADACLRAARLGVTEIELRWNGRRVEKSLDITSQRLTVRAAADFRPIVVFQPPVIDRQMVRVSGGSTSRLTLQGLEFRLELPAEPADGWALIAMGTAQSLELSDCVLTVKDGDADRPPIHDQVAMIVVQPRRPSETMAMMDPQLAMTQQATIALDRCIARGEATFISLSDETPLAVTWNQGLLATSRRMLETGGSAANPKFFEKLLLDLDFVTASCRQGLYLRRSSGKNYQFPVIVTAEHCIFMTEPDAPLYEFAGVTNPSEKDLQVSGDHNRYPDEHVIFLRSRPDIPGERDQDYGLDIRPWSIENRSQVGIPWLQPPQPNRPAHLLTKADFAMDAAMASGAGFDPLLLPDSASASPMDPASPTADPSPPPADSSQP
jgi:hypothetical protein